VRDAVALVAPVPRMQVEPFEARPQLDESLTRARGDLGRAAMVVGGGRHSAGPYLR
jgi:hypothetical protein